MQIDKCNEWRNRSQVRETQWNYVSNPTWIISRTRLMKFQMKFFLLKTRPKEKISENCQTFFEKCRNELLRSFNLQAVVGFLTCWLITWVRKLTFYSRIFAKIQSCKSFRDKNSSEKAIKQISSKEVGANLSIRTNGLNHRKINHSKKLGKNKLIAELMKMDEKISKSQC